MEWAIAAEPSTLGEVKAGPPACRHHGYAVEMVTELTME